MQRAAGEISHWAEYDYVLVNDDIANASPKSEAIVAAERLKRARQAELVTFVRDLVAGSARLEQLEEARRGAGSRARAIVERRFAPRHRRPIARAASARRG